jgi:hypothetical protein
VPEEPPPNPPPEPQAQEPLELSPEQKLNMVTLMIFLLLAFILVLLCAMPSAGCTMIGIMFLASIGFGIWFGTQDKFFT